MWYIGLSLGLSLGQSGVVRGLTLTTPYQIGLLVIKPAYEVI